MTDQPVDANDPYAALAGALADPPTDLSARAEMLDATVRRLQDALTALDEV